MLEKTSFLKFEKHRLKVRLNKKRGAVLDTLYRTRFVSCISIPIFMF